MKLRTIVCDLDGTLLGNNGQISPETLSAITKLPAAGIQLILATGRPYQWTGELCHILGHRGILISSNGGMIHRLSTGDMLACQPISPQLSRDFFDCCANSHCNLFAYTPETIYYSLGNPRLQLFLDYNKRAPAIYQVPLTPLAAEQTWPYQQVVKFLLWQASPVNTTCLSALLEHPQLSVSTSQKNNLDIMAQHVSKGQALSILQSMGLLELETTAAFGDNFNDLDMLSSVRLGIAMGNAPRQICQHAQAVTLSNEQHGVAHAIENWILKGEYPCSNS